MKLFAQQGFGDGEKTLQGLSENLIDGVILSPRDLHPARTDEKITAFRNVRADAEILLDPQFYATFIAASETARTGKLTEWPHFAGVRKSDLELAAGVDDVLRVTFDSVMRVNASAIIAPNIYVSRSFDSREGVIAKNFIRQARSVYEKFGDNRPLLATIAVCREALLERSEFEEFLNDITCLKNPPDGFYVLVGSRGAEAYTDILHADVIGRWMLLNHSLTINGFRVINGFSDVLTPFLGIAGGSAGATGWYSNLRLFSLDRFAASPGMARQPIPRYLSVALLNRITFTEKDAFAGLVPIIQNNLPHDADYDPEPDRTAEALQTWEALRVLNALIVAGGDMGRGLEQANLSVSRAEAAYAEIAEVGLSLDRKSGPGHLPALREGLLAFKKLAGLA